MVSQTDPYGDSGTYDTYTRRFHFCKEDGATETQQWCTQYFVEAMADPNGYVKQDTLVNTRNAIRQNTVWAALTYGAAFLEHLCSGPQGCPLTEFLRTTDYDGDYTE